MGAFPSGRPATGRVTTLTIRRLFEPSGEHMGPQHERAPGFSRRDFLRLGWSSATGAKAGSAEPTTSPSGTESPAIRICLLDEVRPLPVGTVRGGPRGSQVYVARVPEGLLALSARCPRDGSVVRWQASDPSEDELGARGRFYCARDASIFNRQGLLVAGPSPGPLEALRLFVRDGAVWVAPSARTEAEEDDRSARVFRLEEGSEA